MKNETFVLIHPITRLSFATNFANANSAPVTILFRKKLIISNSCFLAAFSILFSAPELWPNARGR